MLNIGFRAMAQAAVAGVIGIMVPALVLLNSPSDPVNVLICILFALLMGFAVAATMDHKIIINLKQQLAERVPITRGDKGRFVKHE